MCICFLFASDRHLLDSRRLHDVHDCSQTKIMLIFTSFSRIFRGIFSGIATFFSLNALLLWDIGLTIVNLVAPKKKIGSVVPEGKPGHKGIWPEYIAPKQSDSR